MSSIKRSPRQTGAATPNTRLADMVKAQVRNSFKEAVSRLPATVIKVDYDRCMVDCKVSVRNDYGENNKNIYADLYDVPLFINAANTNKARLTMPIKAGDLVEIGFCDKDPTNFILSDGKSVTTQEYYSPFSMGSYLYSLIAYPCIQIPATARPLDPNNVVLENEKAIYALSPDGTHHLVDGQGSDVKLSGGKLVATVPNGAVVNGCQITPDGNVITKEGVDLNAFYAEFKSHVHGGVASGGSKTSPPV